MHNSYITPAGEGYFELTEKKSRFLGYVVPTAAPEAAEEFIAKIKAAHPDARHHVFAYVCGGIDGGAEARRMSDDGEPQGTGGVPCLDVLTKRGLSCAAVVVVRYFGGILLGAPGLVRAYGKAAAGAADNAGIVTMQRCRRIDVTCDYQLYGKVSRALESAKECRVTVPEFGENVRASAIMPADRAASFAEYMVNLTNSRAEVSVSDESFFEPKLGG